MSLAQTNLCSKRSYDAQDPRCAQVILHGQFVPVSTFENSLTSEYDIELVSISYVCISPVLDGLIPIIPRATF